MCSKSIFNLAILLAFSFIFKLQAQDNVKKGVTFGALPAITYNSDLGFQYGALASIYDYRDGSIYPKYFKMMKVEVSRFTKGSGINQFFFDSEHLFPKKKIRLTADLSYLTDQACDFYGFNGFESYFNPAFSDDNDTSLYISRMYYRMERNLLRFTLDLQGKLKYDKLRWIAGIASMNYAIGTVDINRLNKGKSAADLLPDTALLYDKYVSWGLLDSSDADGGSHQIIKLGLVYDTRDIEANPSKGIWTEAFLLASPSFLFNKENPFLNMVAIHRQYFTIFPKKLSFVYRVGCQLNLSGQMPFYLQSYMFSSFPAGSLVEGLGGAKSLRGILRDRIVGKGMTWSNFEFRWKFSSFVFKKQNIYLALNPFLDAGRVIQKSEINISSIPAWENTSNYFTNEKERFHFASGCGLHIGLNENFVVAADYGFAFNQQDGKTGLYIGINWLF